MHQGHSITGSSGPMDRIMRDALRKTGAACWLISAIVVSTLTVRAPPRIPEPPPQLPDAPQPEPSGEACPAIFGCEALT